jgi:hypothetical protein
MLFKVMAEHRPLCKVLSCIVPLAKFTLMFMLFPFQFCHPNHNLLQGRNRGTAMVRHTSVKPSTTSVFLAAYEGSLDIVKNLIDAQPSLLKSVDEVTNYSMLFIAGSMLTVSPLFFTH